MGCSSSQPQPSQPPRSPINAFLLEELTHLTFQRTPLTGKNPILARQRIAWTTEKKLHWLKAGKPFLKTTSVDSPKFADIAFPNLSQGSQGSNKRHKSFGTSSKFDDQWAGTKRAKNKGSKASASSTMNDDALARLVVNEMTVAKVEQCEKFIELKRREVECCEREIAATEYRAQQEDMKLYLQPYDHLTGE
ncbi:hypothetical protein Tco_0591703 [Tanacetum coccineum]